MTEARAQRWESIRDSAVGLARRVGAESRAVAYVWRAGMIGPDPPKRTLEVFRAIDRLGQLGGAIAIAAIRHGDRTGLIDELGTFLGQTPPAPSQPSSVVLLTSGTTGTPKGAPRHQGRSLVPVGALLSKVPYRAGESTYVAAPMFHGLGFTQMLLSATLGCTTVVHRRFKPSRVLEAIAEHRLTALWWCR